MIVFIFHNFYHRLPFLDSLIHILITTYWKIIFFYFLKFTCTILESKKVTSRKLIRITVKVKDIEKESAGTMIKRLCFTTKNGKILKICYLLKNKHVSLNNDPNGWVVEFCVLYFCLY